MRRLGTAVLVTALLGIGTGTALAQEPSPDPEPMGQRVEIPWEDIAVTFPPDWTVVVGEEERWPGLLRRMMSRIPIFPSQAAAFAPDQLGDPGSEERCTVVTSNSGRQAPDDMAFALGRLRFEGESSVIPVSLPAGEAAQLSQRSTVEDRVVHDSVYVIAREPGYVWLWCTSLDEAPDDRWLSIAETIEFLPFGE